MKTMDVREQQMVTGGEITWDSSVAAICTGSSWWSLVGAVVAPAWLVAGCIIFHEP